MAWVGILRSILRFDTHYFRWNTTWSERDNGILLNLLTGEQTCQRGTPPPFWNGTIGQTTFCRLGCPKKWFCAVHAASRLLQLWLHMKAEQERISPCWSLGNVRCAQALHYWAPDITSLFMHSIGFSKRKPLTCLTSTISVSCSTGVIAFFFCSKQVSQSTSQKPPHVQARRDPKLVRVTAPWSSSLRTGWGDMNTW